MLRNLEHVQSRPQLEAAKLLSQILHHPAGLMGRRPFFTAEVVKISSERASLRIVLAEAGKNRGEIFSTEGQIQGDEKDDGGEDGFDEVGPLDGEEEQEWC